ncbi:hypothetical protein L916_02754, partial [Phytophthora nicotianae]
IKRSGNAEVSKIQLSEGQKVAVQTASGKLARLNLPSTQMIDSKTVKKVEEADPRGVRFMNSLKGNDTSQFSAKEKPQ